MSNDQFSWLISIALHGVLIIVISITWVSQIKEETKILVPVKLAMVEKKVVQKPVAKKKKEVITKKALPKSVKVNKPTSLPGDRVAPTVAHRLNPTYPKKALNNDWEGFVKVKVNVSDKGDVTSVTVLSSSGYEVLDQSFIRTIKNHYKFNPKRSMGKNTSGSLVLYHSFKIGSD